MATLSIPRQYASGQILQKAHLDAIKEAIETLVNTTQLSYENINIDETLQSLTQSQAETILTTGGYGTLVTSTLLADQALTTTSANFCSISLSAGTYLLAAIGHIDVTQNSYPFSGGLGGYFGRTATVTCRLWNATAGTEIGGGQAKSIATGGLWTTYQPTNSRMTSTFSWVYPVTLSVTTEICLQAVFASASGGSGSLLAGAQVQAYRIRSA